jgi:hypothetical protein
MLPRVQTESLAPTHAEIAIHAYHLWEEEGRPSGHEQEHWLKAERQLLELHKQEERALRGWEKAHGLKTKRRRQPQAAGVQSEQD